MTTKQEIRDYFAKFGKEGGKATARNRTAEERSEAARKAVQARWTKNEERIAEALKEVDEGTRTLLKRARARKAKRKEKA
ncbi:MAG: hypothetical protein ABSE44_14265 [Candidatus Sulfotelmatobacter sp.]|jgi:hypothetical protein